MAHSLVMHEHLAVAFPSGQKPDPSYKLSATHSFLQLLDLGVVRQQRGTDKEGSPKPPPLEGREQEGLSGEEGQ